MDNFSGIKELYDISLRTNHPIEIGARKFDINEAILFFERAEIAQIQENKNERVAKGGYGNDPLIFWESDKEIRFSMTHGVLSPTSWALLSNSKIAEPTTKSVCFKETLQCTEDTIYCFVDLKYCPNACSEIIGAQPNPDLEILPMGRREELLLKPLPPTRIKWIYCYDIETGSPIREFEIYGNRVYFKRPYRKVCVDYTFTFCDKMKTLEVGNRLMNGFLRLDAKMSVKDQNSGEVTTAILEMPKIKLSSSLSMRLGSNYDSSVVSDFYFVGYPDEERPRKEERTIGRITFLGRELTGDYI